MLEDDLLTLEDDHYMKIYKTEIANKKKEIEIKD
tara:strand:+ start:263 stop:364 length:102 start_codon:yes stop_codon:yes gene_type:complete